MQRRGAERDDRRHGVGQRFETGCKRHSLIELGVEREHRRFVPRVEPAENVARGFARVLELSLHAATDVEEQRHADAGHIAAEVRDRLCKPRVRHFEVACAQILDEPSFAIAHHRRHPHQVYPGLERRHRRRLASDLTQRGRRAVLAEAEEHDCRSGDECGPHRQSRTLQGSCHPW